MIERVLVPVDFSDASLVGLSYAVELVKPFEAEIILLAVVEPLAQAGDFGILLEEYQRVARDDLLRLESRWKRPGLRLRAVLKTGAAARVIVEQAATEQADLIVMATHGRSGLSHLLLGSVAERVVRTASCPVLTVRPSSATGEHFGANLAP